VFGKKCGETAGGFVVIGVVRLERSRSFCGVEKYAKYFEIFGNCFCVLPRLNLGDAAQLAIRRSGLVSVVRQEINLVLKSRHRI
jgi:hypothetical protein